MVTVGVLVGCIATMVFAIVFPDADERTALAAWIGLFIGATTTTLAWIVDRANLKRKVQQADSDHFTIATNVGVWDETHTVPLTRELVRHILEHATEYSWTLQGFGLLRLYLAGVGRLHVWDDRYKFLDVSEIHDHFWPLRSRVIAGELVNLRYSVDEKSPKPTHLCQRIVTGEGGGPSTEPYPVELKEISSHRYLSGEFYEQTPTDVHWTVANRGTVTLMARPKGAEGAIETARVFYEIGERWGTAEPRMATKAEVHDITQYALRRWF